jgi:hypothetical protein
MVSFQDFSRQLACPATATSTSRQRLSDETAKEREVELGSCLIGYPIKLASANGRSGWIVGHSENGAQTALGKSAPVPATAFLLIYPHITNNAADDPLGNSWPPRPVFRNPAGRGA